MDAIDHIKEAQRQFLLFLDETKKELESKPQRKTVQLKDVKFGRRVKLCESGVTYTVMEEYKLKHICIFLMRNNKLYSYPLDKEVILA